MLFLLLPDAGPCVPCYVRSTACKPQSRSCGHSTQERQKNHIPLCHRRMHKGPTEAQTQPTGWRCLKASPVVSGSVPSKISGKHGQAPPELPGISSLGYSNDSENPRAQKLKVKPQLRRGRGTEWEEERRQTGREEGNQKMNDRQKDRQRGMRKKQIEGVREKQSKKLN